MEKEIELKAKDFVLVREFDDGVWGLDIYSHEDEDGQYCTIGGIWKHCIPYEGNEYLLGTSNPYRRYKITDGEYIHISYVDSGNEYIAIAEKYSSLGFLKTYADLQKGGRLCPRDNSFFLYEGTICHATDEEKKELDLRLKEEGKYFDETDKKIKDTEKDNKCWIPKSGEMYWSIFMCENYTFSTMRVWWDDTNSEFDKIRLQKGWIFKTEKEAKDFCDKLNKFMVIR